MTKPSVRIENWRRYGNVLEGYVYGHPHINEGRRAVTSTIIFMDERLGICETRNTVYQLGKKGEE